MQIYSMQGPREQHNRLREVTEPLRAYTLPFLPAARLAALRSTCVSLQEIVDNNTGTVAASAVLQEGSIRRPPAAVTANSVQQLLLKQAELEATIWAGRSKPDLVAELLLSLYRHAPEMQISDAPEGELDHAAKPADSSEKALVDKNHL